MDLDVGVEIRVYCYQLAFNAIFERIFGILNFGQLSDFRCIRCSFPLKTILNAGKDLLSPQMPRQNEYEDKGKRQQQKFYVSTHTFTNSHKKKKPWRNDIRQGH